MHRPRLSVQHLAKLPLRALLQHRLPYGLGHRHLLHKLRHLHRGLPLQLDRRQLHQVVRRVLQCYPTLNLLPLQAWRLYPTQYWATAVFRLRLLSHPRQPIHPGRSLTHTGL